MPDQQPLRSPRLRSRRNLRLITAGVLAICLSGLGAAWLYSSVAGSRSVLALAHTVYRDQVITADDVAVISLPDVPGVETVVAERLDEVVGQTALVDLVEGSVLSPRGFGAPAVEAGTVRIGLKLAPGRLPATQLEPGTAVLLVAVPRDGSSEQPGPSVTARVASLASVLPDGATLIDVTVPEAQAESIARLAAADQLALVRQAGGAR